LIGRRCGTRRRARQRGGPCFSGGEKGDQDRWLRTNR
jgi:hypothetical protein